MQMAGLTDKEKWEQKVFIAFTKRCGLNISESSIKSREPPMPDISCNLDGNGYFFELAEVVPEVQAEALSTEGVYSSMFPDPGDLGPRAMINILQKKQQKTYKTGGFPVDLLLYFSKDFPMYLPDVKSEGAEPTDIDDAVQNASSSENSHESGVTAVGLIRPSFWPRFDLLTPPRS